MDPTAADDLSLLLESQRAEFAAASTAESDLDLAFRLQLQEAMAASLAAAPSSTAAASAPPNPPPAPGTALSDLSEAIALQGLELERYRQEHADDELRAAELRRASEELRRRAHDERFAREIAAMSDDEWDDYGDHFERPFDARASGQVEEESFLLYFKGMASTYHVRGKLMQVGAVGVAVCEPGGNLVLKVQKPVAIGAAGASREVLDAKALIEGLNAVVSLGIKRVNVFFDFRVLYNHVIGKWGIKQRKIANMIDQVMLLRRKLERCGMFLLPRCHAQFVFKLARDVIESQMTKDVDFDSKNNLTETCDICLEDTDSSQMFSVDGCLHRFCFSCMEQHVEVKLLIGMLPGCPHEGCKVMLNLESSKKFLSPRLYEIMTHRINEASIPAAEKIYCPYPKCSALMSRSEAIRPQGFSSFQHYFVDTGLRNCIKCNGSFCINCKVPWHDKMSCYEYRQYLQPRAEDTRVKSLANQNSWRQCVKCNHMIELAEGCFHITCRCGYEFCYTCGAEWKNKKATCSCPLWDEDNILHDDADEDYNEDEDEYYDSDGDYYDDEEDFR